MRDAVIIPTGNEVRDGTVLDTDSPVVLGCLISRWPLCAVRRLPPVQDRQDDICRTVKNWAGKTDLVVLIGGSGGGHRYSDTLSEDFTHSALEELLEQKSVREIYGKNGHMWCKLICGKLGCTTVINVPGPHVEAQAAIQAFCRTYDDRSGDLSAVNAAMAESVLAQYPGGGDL